MFGWKPGLKVSTAGSGVCEGPRLVLVRIAAFLSVCFYAGITGPLSAGETVRKRVLSVSQPHTSALELCV